MIQIDDILENLRHENDAAGLVAWVGAVMDFGFQLAAKRLGGGIEDITLNIILPAMVDAA